MPGEHYSEFIKETFIDPIRSVLIVDDDYPTFDEVLDEQLAASRGDVTPSAKAWRKNPERIKNVITRFRNHNPPLLVDIHDGTNVPVGAENKTAAHLHQSDLLVLDYQLDRTKEGDGSMAFEIIRSLMNNDHFNLVVVHTSEALDTVFRNTLVAMLPPGLYAPSDAERAIELLTECEEHYDHIRRSIGEDAYIFARRCPKKCAAAIATGTGPFAAFKAACEGLKWSISDQKEVAAHFLAEIETGMKPRLNPNQAPGLTWNEDAAKYIMTDTVFVAFSEKGDDCDLIGSLLHALSASRPLPSRLFLAKLRAAVDEYGVIAQKEALKSQHALAHWYRRLLSSDGSERQWHIDDSVARHSERLMNGILPRVTDFARRLVEVEGALGSADERTKVHFSLDLSKPDVMLRAEQEHNALVSTTPPEGWHLTTGHVFTIDDVYWVCVSPACDMVPGQLRSSRLTAFGEHLPFMAVRLNKWDKSIPDIHSNRYIFLPIKENVLCFCFNEPSDDLAGPVWHTLYAKNRGKFDAGLSFKVRMAVRHGNALVQRVKQARVVAQLRYEYALNLVQKLGGSMTRIGLDFVGSKAKSP